MTRALSTPLQDLLSQAARQEPSGEVTRLRSRQAGASDTVVVLADVSASMSESIGHRRKIDVLQEALSAIWPNIHNGHLVAFSNIPVPLSSPSDLPAPSGSTALDLGLASIESLRPARTLVISDGRPDNPDQALEVAGRLTGRIDVIYCGPEGDIEAIEFLSRLARSSGGGCTVATPAQGAALNLIAPVRRLLLCDSY